MTASSSTNVDWRPRLPPNLGDWRYPSLEPVLRFQGMMMTDPRGGKAYAPTQRFWDRALLSYGTTHAAYEQLRPVLAKLHSGERIVVTALGSSIISDIGGGFHSDLSKVSELVSLLSNNYPQKAAVPFSGFLYSFMALLNGTFPHRDHVLVNNGIPGASMAAYASASCMEVALPTVTDLIIIEQHEWDDNDALMLFSEQLLWRLYVHYHGRQQHPPAIILLSAMWVTDISIPNDQGPNACIRHPKLCATDCKDNFTSTLSPHMPGRQRTLEDVLYPLVQYYGITALSFRNFLRSMMRDGVLVRAGLTECTMLGGLLMDPIHPKELGSTLFADFLFNHFVEAEQYFAMAQWDNLHTPAYEGVQVPKDELMPGGHHAMIMRCYGHVDGKVWSREDSESESLGTLEVLNMSGFQYVTHQLHGAVKKYKPGWVAEQPGSIMTFVVDSAFPHGHAEATAFVAITYLKSYAHMGQARFSCVSGCACKPSTASAHDAGEMVSVSAAHEFPVTQSPRCVIQVEVLPTTDSTEHKFKIIQVLTKGGM